MALHSFRDSTETELIVSVLFFDFSLALTDSEVLCWFLASDTLDLESSNASAEASGRLADSVSVGDLSGDDTMASDGWRVVGNGGGWIFSKWSAQRAEAHLKTN